MNIVFGSASINEKHRRSDGIASAIEAVFGKKPTVLGGQPATPISIGYLSDDGVIIGRADDQATSLVYIGALNKPLPDWPDELSPVDDTDATARYLLGRFHAKGADFLNGVTGAYVVVIHNRSENRLLLAADPGGGRVLFVHEQNGNLAFSTHLLTLAKGLGLDAVIDRSYEDFFLIYGFFPFNQTPLKNVRFLRAGEIIDWAQDGVDRHTIREGDPWAERYGDLDFQDMSEDDVTSLLHKAFFEAMEEQLSTTEDVAVLLGGFDSALIAAVLQRLGKRVETFSFYYGEDKYNQPHTDTLSKFLGIKHNWIPITAAVIEDGIRNYAKRFSFATNWLNYPVQTEYLCREMRDRGYHYCYSGDGCDSIFLGYPRVHFVSKGLSRVGKLPTPIVNAAVSALNWGGLERSMGRPYRVILSLLRSAGRDMPQRGFLTFRVFDETSIARLRSGDTPKQAASIEEILAKLTENMGSLSRDRIAYLGKAAISPNKSKMVGSSDSTGMVISSPYLHPGLKQLATRLPDSFSRPGEKTESYVTGKYTLMKMAERYGLLPKEIIYQKKMSAVDAPIDYWYYGPLRNIAKNELRKLPFNPDEKYLDSLLSSKWLESVYREKISSDNLTSHELSLLISYARIVDFQ